MEYHGSCHCGSIKVILHTTKTPSELGSRSCTCSFCQIHGASWTSDPSGSLTIQTSGAVNEYHFGSGSAAFLICGTCGVASTVTWKSGSGKLLGVVRVHCLGRKDELLAYEKQTDFGEETLDDRLGRWTRNWTPVRIEKEDVPVAEKKSGSV